MSLADQLGAQSQQLQELAISQNIRGNQARALDVISSDEVRRAVDLAGIAPAERERYGRNLFGQSVLLGRRLLEAGARLVQCNWQRTQGRNGFAWDTHWNNFTAHKEDLVPPYDQAFNALMTDLDRTGRLEETLVVVAAEFGRSPKITRSNSGREHWPECYSVLFAGGGIRGGQVVGRTSADGMTVEERPVATPDLLATICLALGLDPRKQNMSNVGRPIRLVDPAAKPIREIVGSV
jgi:hypothetical protein